MTTMMQGDVPYDPAKQAVPVSVLPEGVAAASQPGTSILAGLLSAVLLAANANRAYALLVNVSDSVVYLKLGAAAVVGEGIPLAPNGGFFEIGGTRPYTGAINGISAGAGKSVLVTEY